MHPSDPSSPRIERMKKVLAESYPQAEGHRKESLPESVRAALGGTARSGAPKVPLFETLRSWLRGPQLVALGAAAVVIVVVALSIGPSREENSGGLAMRSGGGTVSEPPVIMLRGLSEEQSAALRNSGYFRPEQLRVAPADENSAAFLEANRQPNLVLVDGTAGEISAPFAGDDGPAPIPFVAGESDLAPLLLDMLAKLPEPETAE